MNADLRKKAKNDFEKKFKFIHNAFSGKTTENVRKRRDYKLVTREKRRNYLVSELPELFDFIVYIKADSI